MCGLKILVLGTRGFPEVQGGVEKHCEELYPRLAKLGCDVSIFTRTPYIPKKKRIRSWKNVKFIHLWCPRIKSLEAIIHTFLGVILARLKSPDLLHIHAIGPSIFVPLARLLKLKVVITNHGPDYERKKWGKLAKKILKLGEFLGSKFSNNIIVISNVIKRMIENKYGRKDLALIPNGVKLPEPVLTKDKLLKYHLEPKKYSFTACRFVPEKGLHNLINAFKSIKKPQFKLVIAGDADHETDYSRKIKKSAEKNKNIILTGFISGDLLKVLFSNAGLFVLPSYYEGLPIALLEALSYGLPVLVSDIPQNREVPLPDFRYFPPDNVVLLASKIQMLFKKKISKEEKEHQYKILLENYNWDKIAQQTLQVYKKLQL